MYLNDFIDIYFKVLRSILQLAILNRVFGMNNTTASISELNCRLWIHIIIHLKHVYFLYFYMGRGQESFSIS